MMGVTSRLHDRTATMSTTVSHRPPEPRHKFRGRPPEVLHNGDRMTREEFHASYAKAPEHFKAELIGGTVFVASPVSRQHGMLHLFIGSVLPAYVFRTPGLETGSETTAFLDDESEPQPDLFLRVLPEYGGRSRTSDDGKYVVGPPEFVIEIAYSSRAIDLYAKRDDYARAGVLEYLVWVVRDRTFVWFDLVQGTERPIPSDAVVRSSAFPGLWLDSEAVRIGDYARLMSTLEAGLATPEHAAFVKRLAETKR